MIHLSDLPFHVAFAVKGAVVSGIGALGTWILGEFDPALAETWGMKGILICTVVFLAGCILWMVRWHITVHTVNQQASTEAMNRVANALEDQNQYFQAISQKALNERLNAPQNFTPDPPTRSRRPR